MDGGLCFNFNCPQRISVQGRYRVVDQYHVDIAGWHSGQLMSVQLCLPFCTDACALHFLETDAQGEDRPGIVKTNLEVLESVLLAHQKWCQANNGGDVRRYAIDTPAGEVFEPDYQAVDLPRQVNGQAVITRVRIPTTWSRGESYAAIAYTFDSIQTRAEFSRSLVTTDEKLTFFLTRARQLASQQP